MPTPHTYVLLLKKQKMLLKVQEMQLNKVDKLKCVSYFGQQKGRFHDL